MLCEAKVHLLDDITSLETSVKLPHIPRRREGDSRVVREIDDIVTIFTRLDEHKLLDQLPRYCASGPDEMPSSRICEGDLNVFMTMLEKLHGKIDELRSVMAAISRDVEVLQTRLPPELFPPLPRADFAQPSRQPTAGNSAYRKSLSESSTSATEGHLADRQVNTLIQPGDSWAAAAMSSPVIATSNRFAVLRSCDDYNCDNDGTDPQLFQEVRSRQAAKRKRQYTADQQRQQQSAESHQREAGEQQPGRQARQRNGRWLTGTSSNRGLAAAKKLVKKKVFCIDNVDTSFSPDDVQRYVSSFPVNVLSCFPAKPRRRRNENEPITDRKAFRLRIDANDQDKLLDPGKWPDSITIAEWYHLSSSASRQHGDADGETGNAVSLVVVLQMLVNLLFLMSLSLMQVMTMKSRRIWRVTTRS